MLTQRLSDLKRHNLYLTNNDELDEPESSRRRLTPKDMKCLMNEDEFDLPESSRRLPTKEMKCFKCKQFGHLIADYPCWEGKPSNRWKYLHCSGFTRMDRHTKLSKKNELSSSSSTRPVTDAKSKATIE